MEVDSEHSSTKKRKAAESSISSKRPERSEGQAKRPKVEKDEKQAKPKYIQVDFKTPETWTRRPVDWKNFRICDGKIEHFIGQVWNRKIKEFPFHPKMTVKNTGKNLSLIGDMKELIDDYGCPAKDYLVDFGCSHGSDRVIVFDIEKTIEKDPLANMKLIRLNRPKQASGFAFNDKTFVVGRDGSVKPYEMNLPIREDTLFSPREARGHSKSIDFPQCLSVMDNKENMDVVKTIQDMIGNGWKGQARENADGIILRFGNPHDPYSLESRRKRIDKILESKGGAMDFCEWVDRNWNVDLGEQHHLKLQAAIDTTVRQFLMQLPQHVIDKL